MREVGSACLLEPGGEEHQRSGREADAFRDLRAIGTRAGGFRLFAVTVQRRHRLSRSRDFDDVYRRGTSASTRYLVLHWFPREDDSDGDPRLGLAVPRSVGSAVVRNKVKRLLREAWRGLLPSVPAGHDYVLVARPGLAEPAQSRGPDWLASEISSALEKVRS